MRKPNWWKRHHNPSGCIITQPLGYIPKTTSNFTPSFRPVLKQDREYGAKLPQLRIYFISGSQASFHLYINYGWRWTRMNTFILMTELVTTARLLMKWAFGGRTVRLSCLCHSTGVVSTKVLNDIVRLSWHGSPLRTIYL